MPTERYLALETSSPRLSLAAGDEQRLLASYQGPLEWRHADTLFDGIQTLLGRLRWKASTLTGIAVSQGPGSFTGLRIGLAAARAFGQASRIPVVGVPSLQSLALSAPPGARWINPMIDALRGHVFAALYERQDVTRLKVIHREVHVPLSRWIAFLRRRTRGQVWLTGDALAIYENDLKKIRGVRRAAREEWYPRAEALLVLARGALAKASVMSYKTVIPLYLREAAALERIKR